MQTREENKTKQCFTLKKKMALTVMKLIPCFGVIKGNNEYKS